MKAVLKIKEKLKNKALCFGTHCSTTDVDFYEMCGLLDYDYVWIDNEHAGMTQPMVKNAIIATNARGAAAFVRVPDHEIAHVKPVLECGPDGVIFPMVNTASQARHCVSICAYPPGGVRGFGPLRAIDYGVMDLDKYISSIDSSLMRIMQCEHVEAVENLDEILEVPGVDAIICGPMDLSASAGKLGKFSDATVVELMNTIISKCKAHDKPFGLSIGVNMELVKYWIDAGASFVSMGTPQDYFREMSRDIVKRAREFESHR